MPVLFAYVDESHNETTFCLSAIIIRDREWVNCFSMIRDHRKMLKSNYGIKLSGELHAYKLVRGKGRSFCDRELTKHERSRVFGSMLDLVASLPHVMLFNVVLKKKDHTDAHLAAWDRFMNRLERTLTEYERLERFNRQKLIKSIAGAVSAEDIESISQRLIAYSARAVVVADEGREREITTALRKMHRFNQIPSRFGTWDDGNITKNICVERVIEDPVFRNSERSYFIQLADAVAYSLLKREVPPTPVIAHYGIDRMFDDKLSKICFTKASIHDPLGIVRK